MNSFFRENVVEETKQKFDECFLQILQILVNHLTLNKLENNPFNFAEEKGTHRILPKDRVGNFRTCAFNALEKHSKGLSCKCTHFEFSHLDGDFHIFKHFPENEIERLSKA